MKTYQLLLLSLLCTIQVSANNQPTPNVGEEYKDATPPSEIITNKGKEYIKSYEYIMPLAGYASTIYYNETDIEDIKNIRKIINAQQQEMRRLNADNFRYASVSVSNVFEMFRYIKDYFSTKELSELQQGDMLFRMLLIANSQKEIVHLNLSYVAQNSKIDHKIIKLQESLKKMIKLEDLPAGFSITLNENDSLKQSKIDILKNVHSGKFKLSDVKNPESVKHIPSGSRVGYDYYINIMMITFDNVIRR